MPKIMPLVSPLSAMQEKAFRNISLQEIDPRLPKGMVTRFGQKVKSKNFVINGKETRWCLAGKYDLLSENEDGTASLIDCKVSKNEESQGDHYAPQLEAYVFALENPFAENLYNVGTGVDLTIKSLAEMIQKAVGHSGDIIWDSSKPDGTPRKLMDVSKMANQGWKSKISLEEGIQSTYKWFLENEDSFKEVKM
jgi:hypothetical protein